MHLTIPPKKVLYPFVLVTSLFFLWGFAYGLLDVLNKHFQNILGVTKLQSTGLQVAYFGLGYLCFSPVAGELLKRRGYKFVILMGLCLYSTGAIGFWPCAKFASPDNKKAVFGGFVICTGIISSGLASLETASNSYIANLPGTSASGAAMRLQIAQTFNGVAVVSGPFIAARYFFTGENATTLTSVQWVYLAASVFGMCIALVFVLVDLPEPVTITDEDEDSETSGSVFKQRRLWFGWLCQFLYVGAQVTTFSFFINYGVEAVGYSDSKSSIFFSYSLILFTIGRVFGIIILCIFPVELFLSIWALFCALFITLAIFLPSTAGLASLMLVYFFEGPLVPAVFISATKDMGKHTRRASAVLVSAVAGGAVFPPVQGAIADTRSTSIGFAICIPAYVYAAVFGGVLWWKRGAKLLLRDEIKQEIEVHTVLGRERAEKLGVNDDEIKFPDSMREEEVALEVNMPVLLK